MGSSLRKSRHVVVKLFNLRAIIHALTVIRSGRYSDHEPQGNLRLLRSQGKLGVE
jgi:hypothetical protein